jgi:hypothetical protein
MLSPSIQLKTQLTKPTQNNNNKHMNSMSSPPELLSPPKPAVVDKSMFTYALTVKHPREQSVDILGIIRADRGWHCKEHAICGHSLEENSLVCIRRKVFATKDKGKMVEQAALSVVITSRRFDNAMIVNHGHHQLLPASTYPNLKRLLQPDIERLEQPREAAGDLNYLDAQILDRCHLMGSAIK